jgi:hypothetical protein
MYEANLFFACINTLHVFKELWELYLFINFKDLISPTYVVTQDGVIHPLRSLRTEASGC